MRKFAQFVSIVATVATAGYGLYRLVRQIQDDQDLRRSLAAHDRLTTLPTKTETPLP